MKTVEVRRHSMRKQGRSLSKDGFRLAREVGRKLETHYDLAVCSPKTRCRETMEAFGISKYSEDRAFLPMDTVEIDHYEDKIKGIARKEGCTSFAASFRVPEAAAALKKKGEELLDALARIARELPEGGKALVVSHGGSIEPAALAGMNQSDLAAMGGELAPCEGVRFNFENDRLTGVDVLRL